MLLYPLVAIFCVTGHCLTLHWQANVYESWQQCVWDARIRYERQSGDITAEFGYHFFWAHCQQAVRIRVRLA